MLQAVSETCRHISGMPRRASGLNGIRIATLARLGSGCPWFAPAGGIPSTCCCRVSLRTLTPGWRHAPWRAGKVKAGGARRTRAFASSPVVSTVERHLVNLYTKIGARGRADAVAFALRHRV